MELSLLEKLIGSHLLKRFPVFVELESAVPHLQVPATCPYPKPDQSNPCPQSHFLKIQFNFMFPPTPRSSM